MARLTRREFLEIAGRQSVATSMIGAFLLTSCRVAPGDFSALGVDRDGLGHFIALIDEIIPRTGGIPAASEVGTMPYLELLAESEPQLPITARESLRVLDALSAGQSARSIGELAPSARGELVARFAEASPELFARLRTYVYEGYYLQPAVWKELGYEPFPTLAPGPIMEPFDPALLNRVRAMPRLYREA